MRRAADRGMFELSLQSTSPIPARIASSNVEACPTGLALCEGNIPPVGVSDLLDDTQADARPLIFRRVSCIEH